MSELTNVSLFLRKVHMPRIHIHRTYAHDSLIMQYYNPVPLNESLYISMHTFSNWKSGIPEGRVASYQTADDKKLTIYAWQLAYGCRWCSKTFCLLAPSHCQVFSVKCQKPTQFQLALQMLFIYSHIFTANCKTPNIGFYNKSYIHPLPPQ